jgi:hypothetical protein
VKTDPGSIAANVAALSASSVAKLEINWSGSTWTDETDNLAQDSLGGSMQLMDPIEGIRSMGHTQAASVSCLMVNTDGRYSYARAGSQANTQGIFGKRARVSLGFRDTGVDGDPEYVQVFLGRIVDVQEVEKDRQVSLSLRDLSSLYTQHSYQTDTYTDQTTDEWVDRLATEAGITTPTPVTEYGMLTVPYVYADNDDVLAEMRKAAAAEGGVVFIDPTDGTLRLWNAAHWVRAAPVATYTVNDFADLSPRWGWENTYNVIPINYQPRQKAREYKVYELKRPIPLAPSEVRTIEMHFRWPLETFTYYELIASTGGGKDKSASISTDTVMPTSSQNWKIEFTNLDTENEVWITRFDVHGFPVEGRQSETYTRPNGTGNDDKEMPAFSNFYVQTEEQSAVLADMLGDRFEDPRLVMTVKQTRGNPLLELGDVVSITATNAGLSKDATVLGINWSFSGAYTMDLTCLDFTDYYASEDYFVVGTSALGASAGYVCFY